MTDLLVYYVTPQVRKPYESKTYFLKAGYKRSFLTRIKQSLEL